MISICFVQVGKNDFVKIKKGDNMDKYIFFKEVLCFTNEELIKKLEIVSQIKKIKKKTILVKEGEKQEIVYFLIDGVFRGYFRFEDHREITDCFGYHCGQPLMDCQGLGHISKITIEAVKDSTVIGIPVSELEYLMNHYPEVMQLYNLFFD